VRSGVVLVTLVLAGCSATAHPGAAPTIPGPREWPASEPTPEPGFDPLAREVGYEPDSMAADRALRRRLGHRDDYKVPAGAVAGLPPGPLAGAVTSRMFAEFRTVRDPRYEHLTPGQKAVYGLEVADEEILNGGFDQYWYNPSGDLAPDLVRAAERVHAPAYAAVFRAAAALWPGGRIPRDREARQRLLDGLDDDALARLDDRYAAFQYHRRTALGLVLGGYVRTHGKQFLAG
jgi:hypothetical protein